MDKTGIKANEMVRAIRDQMHEETKDMTSEEFVEYIHREAEAARRERKKAGDRTRPAA